MTSTDQISTATDDPADVIIDSCLVPTSPRSFFLYAGAGSGKTRSLVSAMKNFSAAYGDEYRRLAKGIAVITYTNAAVDEIVRRIDMDPLFHVSTIHSFCWSLISGFHAAIQSWLLEKLNADLQELREKENKGRPGTNASMLRLQAMDLIKRRLEFLKSPRRFTYNPSGDNFDEDSLSHDEVLKVTANFILNKVAMQKILINSYPFLLIDESQDTNRHLMEAFLNLELKYEHKFALGLFGDTMQRIYPDGMPSLQENIRPEWEKPKKCTNHRSVSRIVDLGNSLRAEIDRHSQISHNDRREGFVRLFVLPSNTPNKPAREQYICTQMAEICSDGGWRGKNDSVKTLTLEHRMAADRCGFLQLFDAIDADGRMKTGLRRGDLPGLRFFSALVYPLFEYLKAKDRYGLMYHLRASSPLLARDVIAKRSSLDGPLLHARDAVRAISEIDIESESTTFFDVLQCVVKHKLFNIPEPLYTIATSDESDLKFGEATARNASLSEDEENSSDAPSSLSAWKVLLVTPFRQIIPYTQYVNDKGPFGTHQGVKGREFDRVLVVIDDKEARGFMFSYETLFGVKSPSARAQLRRQECAETSEDRTRRLMYVTCTRARNSLAVVVYTENPNKCKQSVLKLGWFEESEIILLD